MYSWGLEWRRDWCGGIDLMKRSGGFAVEERESGLVERRERVVRRRRRESDILSGWVWFGLVVNFTE